MSQKKMAQSNANPANLLQNDMWISKKVLIKISGGRLLGIVWELRRKLASESENASYEHLTCAPSCKLSQYIGTVHKAL